MKNLLSEFIPEEIEILDKEDCFIPHMYSSFLKSASNSSFFYGLDLDAAKFVMNKIFYSRGDEVRVPSFQKNLYKFLTVVLRCR